MFLTSIFVQVLMIVFMTSIIVLGNFILEAALTVLLAVLVLRSVNKKETYMWVD